MQSITALAYINELAAYEFPTERWNLNEISFEIYLKFRGKQILVRKIVWKINIILEIKIKIFLMSIKYSIKK